MVPDCNYPVRKRKSYQLHQKLLSTSIWKYGIQESDDFSIRYDTIYTYKPEVPEQKKKKKSNFWKAHRDKPAQKFGFGTVIIFIIINECGATLELELNF
jgi:hypothetical protein